MNQELTAVEALIPHRAPFLFVDRLISIESNHAVAELYVNPQADFFKGHYPNDPIMPGVLLCESLFQTGALFLATKFKEQSVAFTNKVPVLSRIMNAKFKQPVYPGVTLTLKTTHTETLQSFYFFKGSIYNKSILIASVEFALAAVERSTLSQDPS